MRTCCAVNARPARLCLAGAMSPALRLPPSPPNRSPTSRIKTKSIEASVSLDAKIKADAALAADCLTEGKAWMEKSARRRRQASASRTRNCSATAPGRSSANTTSARWSTATTSASSAPTTWTPAARIRIPTSTPSCGIHDRQQAHQHPPLLHRDRRRRPDHEGDGESRAGFADSREEEARRRRDRDDRMVQELSNQNCSRSAR